MVVCSTRRSCDPVVIQKLWNIVDYARVNKQSTVFERIVRSAMKEINCSESEATKRVDSALADGLIEKYTWVVGKGAKAGETMEGIRIPSFSDPPDKINEHDWYCFKCHKPGEVMECSECFRVYHSGCLKSSPKSSDASFVCPICVMDSKAEYKRKQIRKLLEFATHRLKGKPLWKDLSRIGYLDEPGRNDYLLFKYIDLTIIARKIKDGRYRSLESFLVDVNTLCHDVCVIYGDPSSMAELAKALLKEIEAEIYEIRLCTNCYINVKARPSEWVSKPCRPPHELVWAKLKGFPFWPAKVLEEKDTTYEVRFFGSYHERAAVTKESTRPYDIPAEELGVRQTPAFQRAFNEVQKLQKLVSEGYYTSSSGDSDMPPSDDEWEDSQYMFQLPVKPNRPSHSKPKPVKRKTSSSVNRSSVASLASPLPKKEEEEDVSPLPPMLKEEKPIPKSRQANKRKSSTKKSDSKPAKTVAKRSRKKLDLSSTDSSVTSSPGSCVVTSSIVEPVAAAVKTISSPVKMLHKSVQVSTLDHKTVDGLVAVERQKCNDAVEEARRESDSRLKHELEKHETDLRAEFQRELDSIMHQHREAIANTKRRQWCYNCLEEAMYHCCWNTSYCSIKCQQDHWHKDHKKVCRRKR